MSVSGGAVIVGRRNTRHHVENRFYCPPALRKQRQQQQQEQEQQEEHELTLIENNNTPCSSSDNSVSSTSIETSVDVSNLCRFLEHTTPHVPAQCFPLKSKRRWKTVEPELQPYFVLGDLWESFKEWSVYGAGVPLVLSGNESVKQYYNVSLSAIQLYIDPSKPSLRLRKPSKESDSESARDTSSDSSSGYRHERGSKSVVNGSSNLPNLSDPNNLGLERLSLASKPFTGSSDENGSCSALGQLVFEYFEHESPYSREPLVDKIHDLAKQFPDLKTYRSCDLSPSSWVSLAWYPIYRIPVGPTLQDLGACFLTFHSLSTPFQSPTTINCSRKDKDMSSKLSLPIFGLAFTKFKISVWDPEGDSEDQKANSLRRAADNWIRQLQVNHPDYKFFSANYAYCR